MVTDHRSKNQLTVRPDGRSRLASRAQEIVQRAAELFDERGYDRTSMEEIATAVGMKKASLYHHVRSKDQILYWIHDEFIDLITARHEARVQLALTPSQELLEIMGDILELMHTHRGHVRVFFENHRQLGLEYQARIQQKRVRYRTMVEDVVAEGVRVGEFRPIDTRLTTLALFGMCNWAYQWYRKDGPLQSREIAYKFWDLFIQGAAKR